MAKSPVKMTKHPSFRNQFSQSNAMKKKHTWLGGFRIAGVNLNPGRGWGMTGPPEGIPIVRPGIPCGTIGCWPVMGRADCIERTTGGWPRGGTPPRYWAETGYPAPCWLSWAVGRTYHTINIRFIISLSFNWIETKKVRQMNVWPSHIYMCRSDQTPNCTWGWADQRGVARNCAIWAGV